MGVGGGTGVGRELVVVLMEFGGELEASGVGWHWQSVRDDSAGVWCWCRS